MTGFHDELERAGWAVHTTLDSHHSHDAVVQTRNDRLRAAAASRSAFIVKTSHIAGHRYAGNVQVSTQVGVEIDAATE